MNSKYEIYGPLIFWGLLFTCAGVIKYFAYDNDSFWIDIPTELALWSTGILFTLASSERSYSRAKLNTEYTKKQSGTGYEVDFKVVVGDELGFTSKFLYLFLASIVIWIISIIMQGEIVEVQNIDNYEGNKFFIALTVNYVLGIFVTVVAVVSIYQTTK